MECSSKAVASCFRLIATILLLAMAGHCSSQEMDHIQLNRIADSINDLTQVVHEQAVASEKVAVGIMEKFTSVATEQAVASEKVSSGIMKIFTFLARDHLVCERGWFKLRSSCYYMGEDTSAWEESRQKCIALNSDLVKITDDEEYNFVRDLARGHNAYIGLSDLQEEGTYRWVVDGTIHQIVESWWAEGEPSTASEHCIHYFTGKGDRLNDAYCDWEMRYICEKPAQLPWNIASVLDEEMPADK